MIKALVILGLATAALLLYGFVDRQQPEAEEADDEILEKLEDEQ